MLIDTSKLGLQSSKPDKALNTTGNIKLRAVMVNEGAKLNSVSKKLFNSAACCWYV